MKKWHNKYWKYMLDENFEKAIPLKDKNFPEYFYKYRRLNEFTLNSLKSSYLWLAEISTLNDPFECTIQIDENKNLSKFFTSKKHLEFFKLLSNEPLNKNELSRLSKSKTPLEEYRQICSLRNIPFTKKADVFFYEIQTRWEKIVTEINHNLKICSFSLQNSLLLLWSHYSDEHKGICIEYDFQEQEHIRPFIQPVLYQDAIPKIELYDDYSTMRMVCSSLVKSPEWKYEKEWRITNFRQNGLFDSKIKAPTPTSICLGSRFNKNDIELKADLIAFVKANKIPLYRMKKHPNEFKLIKENYTP